MTLYLLTLRLHHAHEGSKEYYLHCLIIPSTSTLASCIIVQHAGGQSACGGAGYSLRETTFKWIFVSKLPLADILSKK